MGKQIGLLVSERLKSLGMDLPWLSAKTMIVPSVLDELLERGSITQMSPEEVERLAEVLGISTDTLEMEFGHLARCIRQALGSRPEEIQFVFWPCQDCEELLKQTEEGSLLPDRKIRLQILAHLVRRMLDLTGFNVQELVRELSQRH